MMLSTKEEWIKALTERHGKELQQTFSSATVAICGLGGLGSNIAIHLARAGIGKLILIDFDRVDITNLHRQQYKASQIGLYKTEALAENLSGLDGILVPVMDARRDQVYTAVFNGTGGGITRITEDLAISVEELAERLAPYRDTRKIYLCGDGYAVVKRAFDKLGVATENTPPLLIAENAYSVAKVALRMHARGECTDDLKHNPTYLRVPQAERERIERLNKET